MKCDKCGSVLIQGKRFCVNCGAPVSQEQATPPAPVPTQQAQAPAQPDAPVTPTPPPAPVAPVLVPPTATPRGIGKLKGRSKGWTALAIALVAIIVAGVVVLIVFLALPDKQVASIKDLKVTRKDGKTLDLKKVPLGVDMVLTATFDAKYSQGGKGEVRLGLMSSDGDELIGKTFQVKSQNGTQTRTYKVYMTKSSGKTIKAQAKLDVWSGSGEKATDEVFLPFVAEKGTVEDTGSSESIDVVRKRVEDEFTDLMTTTKTAIASGTDVSDLKNRIADLGVKVVDASTVEELESAETEIKDLQAEIQKRMAAK